MTENTTQNANVVVAHLRAWNPNAIEEAARNDLSLMKPGEVLVILRDAPAANGRR